MKAFLLLLCISCSLLALSPEEANKFVNQYEGTSQKIMGFINCVSKVITGQEVTSPEVRDSKNPAPVLPDTLEGCFAIAGVKLGGLAKVGGIFSKEKQADGTLTPSEFDQAAKQVREELLKEKEKQNETQPDRKPAEAVPPLSTEPEKIPQPAPKINTAW